MTIDTNIAFIGGGAMAQAMIKGLLNAGMPRERIRVAEPHAGQRQTLLDRCGINAAAGNLEVMAGAEVVILAVKPGVVPVVLQEIAAHLAPAALVISIAAGVTLATLAEAAPNGQPLVRVMPNTPALVGAGISAMICAPDTPREQRELAKAILASIGLVEELDSEGLMDGVTALSGSGPAYVYLMAEALSDGGVACGLPRGLADRLAVQTLLGSAAMLQKSGQHPGVLKNQVTSPSGTTIAGLEALEQGGVRGALMAAVKAAWQRSRELSGANKRA
ncbi:MAG: pyrroline-5-carboxylate reductase [Magnetococcales bacterium]|nr:pyrroline-5-carboxylate reductase [Magnetococcales bacterium]